MVENNSSSARRAAVMQISLSRRNALRVSAAALIAGVNLRRLPADEVFQASQESDNTGDGGLLDKPASAMRPDISDKLWDPLCTLGQKGRLLESIALIPAASDEMGAGQDPKLFPNTLFPLFHQVSFEESDPALMKYLSFALPSFPLCFATSKDIQGGWGGSGMRLSLLRIRTTQDTFWVSITRIGFAKGTHGADLSSIFFSVPLTKAVELIYLKATGEPLPQLISEALTGMRQIRKSQESFERWKASQK